MIDRQRVQALYDARLKSYETLEALAKAVLEANLTSSAWKVHAIESRVKSFDSIVDTADRKGLSNPLDQLRDLVGCRAVLLFRSDIAPVVEVLRRAFEVHSVDDRALAVGASQFDYQSVHLEATLGSRFQERFADLMDIPFEIQVRTVCMDAWANLAHHVSYKSSRQLPVSFERSLNALSAHFYVADTLFELLRDPTAAARYSPASLETVPPGEVPLTTDSLRQFLHSRLSDRDVDVTADSLLTDTALELYDSGFRTVDQVHRLVDHTAPAVEVLEQRMNDSRGDDVGPIRFSQLGFVRYSHTLMRADLEETSQLVAGFLKSKSAESDAAAREVLALAAGFQQPLGR